MGIQDRMPPKKAPARKPIAKPATTRPGAKKPASTSKTPAKTSSKTKAAAKPKPPSKEHLAAVKIQKCIRGFLAKRRAIKAKEQKAAYEKEIEELEKAAFLEIIRREQEEEERRSEKDRQARAKITRAKKRQKIVLEAAFDDEIGDIEKAINDATRELDDPTNEAHKQRERRILIEARDANDNSPLGEAAAGGADESIKYLLENKANPNHQGQWGRTPLYRAAFAGHVSTVRLLLEAGADPRIVAKDSNTPLDVAGTDEVRVIFQAWDLSETLKKLDVLDKQQNDYKQLQREEMSRCVGTISDEVDEKKRIFETMKKELEAAFCQYEKRIHEHDVGVQEGFEKPELTIAAINEAELHLESCKVKMERAQQELAASQLKLREQQHHQAHMDDDDEFDDSEQANPLITRCNFKEITDVLFKDVGNKIKDSGKWPLLLDTTGQATLFLRYRDTNMLNILDTRACEPNKLREMLLGSIRYGKPFIIDLGSMDLWRAMEAAIERVHEGLFTQLITKALMENQNYMKLVDEKRDKPEYHASRFVHGFAENFRFVVLTRIAYPPPEWIDTCYAIEIVVSK